MVDHVGDVSISRFVGKFKGDILAYANRYWVEIMPPVGVPGSAGGDFMNSEAYSGQFSEFSRKVNEDNRLGIICHSCSMPGKNFLTQTLCQLGAPQDYPYSQKFDPVSFTFYNDSELRTRKFFEIWQSIMCNLTDNSLNFLNEYRGDIKISQLNRNGEKTYSGQIYQCYPLDLSPNQFAYGDSSFTTTTVTMGYRLWKPAHDDTDVADS